ncbi:MAG: hypothetical protein HRU29_13220 [Rhizobiales bacterium]|nr:hypothetical protein [Hyphomicrobiales bacterium]NRB15353.1 hypothetical protein [Hyphomicrobiales bacterium]
MNTKFEKQYIYAILIYSFFWLVLIMQFKGIGFNDLWGVLGCLTLVVGIDYISWIVFKKWLWKFKLLYPLIVKTPVLEGTWKGYLKTIWVDPKTGKSPDPIPFVLVINQGFNSLNVALHTKESSSYSNSASLETIENTGEIWLSYTYLNTPKAEFKHRSKDHEGSAKLKVIKSLKGMEGQYYNARQMAGDMELEFLSKDKADCFKDIF